MDGPSSISWQQALTMLEERFDKFVEDKSHASDLDDETRDAAYRKGGFLSETILERIAIVACTILRKVEISSNQDVQAATERVSALLDRTLALAYGDDYGQYDYLSSFSHTKETLLQDPMKARWGGELTS